MSSFSAGWVRRHNSVVCMDWCPSLSESFFRRSAHRSSIHTAMPQKKASKSSPTNTLRHSRKNSERSQNGRAHAIYLMSYISIEMPKHVRNRSASWKSYAPSVNSRASAFRAWPTLSRTARKLRLVGFICWSTNSPRCSRSRRYGMAMIRAGSMSVSVLKRVRRPRSATDRSAPCGGAVRRWVAPTTVR